MFTCKHLKQKIGTSTLQKGGVAEFYLCGALQQTCSIVNFDKKDFNGNPIPVCDTCKLREEISPLVTKVESAIARAEQLQSELPKEALAIEGMSSPKVRHLLANLKSSNYLEIGSWKGSTLVAATYSNPGKSTAVDNFSQFTGDSAATEIELRTNLRTFGIDCKVCNASIFTVPSMELPFNVDVCFYDGDHGAEETRRAISRVFPHLADESILIVDDTNMPGVLEATHLGLQDCGANILFKVILPARFNGDVEQWWNGLAVFVIEKPKGPKVTGVCLSYDLSNRLTVLNEAVESFLRQTWPNKELVIVIDGTSAEVVFEHPQIKILTQKDRFKTLGEKYNAGCEAASGEILCSWDDDDISLPNRMYRAVTEIVANSAEYYNPRSYWYDNGTAIVHEFARNYCHNASAFTKSAWLKVGKYKHLAEASQDAAMDGVLRDSVVTKYGTKDKEETAYIYRWGDGLKHVSGGDSASNYASVKVDVRTKKITLSPRWEKDYVGITRKAIALITSVKSKNPIALTIGMACCNDYTGLHETLMSLRMNHSKALAHCEVVVVDNSREDYPHIEAAKNFVTATPGWKYIRYAEEKGPAAAKNKVFENASGEAVILIDSHVQFGEGVISLLLKWYDDNPDTMDLYHGPVVGNDGRSVLATEMLPGYRGLMYGKWHLNLDAFNRGLPWDIWGHGCGLLTCRKEAWLRFSDNHEGFAGEEGYIQEKFRRAGRKVQCLPWLIWCHRWGNFSGISYGTVRQRISNFVFNYFEVGSPPLAETMAHFVAEEKQITQQDFLELVSKCEAKIKADKAVKGPGAYLKSILAWFSAIPIEGCNCTAHADEMDKNGIVWCKNNIPLITSWLKEGAEARGLPFSNWLAERIILRAIKLSEKARASYLKKSKFSASSFS